MSDIQELLAQALSRIERLEDEAAIREVMTRYGLAVDSGDEDACARIYADDCHIDIDGVAFMDGREQSRGIVASPLHQEIMPNCAHIMGPFTVKIDGHSAVATGYATVYLKEGDQVRVWRQSYGRWELVKRDGRWQVLKRISRSTGRDDCQALLNKGV